MQPSPQLRLPNAWPRFDHDTRRYLLRRFPFSIVYRVEPRWRDPSAVRSLCLAPELSSRTFWTFAREFSPFKAQGAIVEQRV
jgi:hypothetical protein